MAKKGCCTVGFSTNPCSSLFSFGDTEDDDGLPYEIPCNVPLAAFILNGSVFSEFHKESSCDCMSENGFPDIIGRHDYTLVPQPKKGCCTND